jgi:hypothetical protein
MNGGDYRERRASEECATPSASELPIDYTSTLMNVCGVRGLSRLATTGIEMGVNPYPHDFAARPHESVVAPIWRSHVPRMC